MISSDVLKMFIVVLIVTTVQVLKDFEMQGKCLQNGFVFMAGNSVMSFLILTHLWPHFIK